MAGKPALVEYQRKRDFSGTPEPAGAAAAGVDRLRFVVQMHAARSLHYDFRLELDGTLKSWAVPKGPTLDPHDKRMAVQVEDHPLSYTDFEGVIPPKQYGAGTVIVWDQGSWAATSDARRGLREGKLKFELDGVKLHGHWTLVRMRQREDSAKPAWLLIKEDDEFARSADEYALVEAEPDSVLGPSAAQREKAPGAAMARQPAKAAVAMAADAKRARLAPQAPQLATLVGENPAGGDWIKLKTEHRQEFVIGGYTDPKGSRQGLGALLLGLHDAAGNLHYAGNVGTGFDEKTLRELTPRLTALEVQRSPFVDAPARVGTVHKAVPHWVAPKLLAEVSFTQWTKDQRVRHSAFHGLRADKPARDIRVEKPSKPAPARRAPPTPPAALRVTHAERLIDEAGQVSKGQLVAYYARVAPLLLPHLAQRPVALLRAPRGVGQPTFFQKHADSSELPHVSLLDPSLDPEHEPLLAIDSAEALLEAAQMNVIELHTWNATTRAFDKPDRIVFDLDPGERVAWQQVQQGAQLLHNFLDELALKSFLKTSGGKGLHIVVPLQPRLGWDAVKGFSQAVVARVAGVLPTVFVAKSGPRNRIGKIYIDYLRNGFGATTVAAWSARARSGMGISVPLGWDELEGLAGSAQWTVADFEDRAAIGNTPWQGYEAARQPLEAAMKILGFDARGSKATRAA